MVDRRLAGAKCRMLFYIRTVKGDLSPNDQGTIVYEYESLERIQILVDWDRGFTVPVFPNEIEIQSEKEGKDDDGKVNVEW